MADNPAQGGGYTTDNPEVFAVAHPVPTFGQVAKDMVEGGETVPFVAATGSEGSTPMPAGQVAGHDSPGAPSSAAPPSHVDVTGGATPSDAGNVDNMAGGVGDAVAESNARHDELESDTHGQGSVIGDLIDLPHSGTGVYPPGQ